MYRVRLIEDYLKNGNRQLDLDINADIKAKTK
jgi:hypothetical protein